MDAHNPEENPSESFIKEDEKNGQNEENESYSLSSSFSSLLDDFLSQLPDGDAYSPEESKLASNLEDFAYFYMKSRLLKEPSPLMDDFVDFNDMAKLFFEEKFSFLIEFSDGNACDAFIKDFLREDDSSLGSSGSSSSGQKGDNDHNLKVEEDQDKAKTIKDNFDVDLSGKNIHNQKLKVSSLYKFTSLPVLLVLSPYSEIFKFTKDNRVVKIHKNYRFYLCMDNMKPLFPPPQLEECFYVYKGKDVNIALLDSGISPHPDLKGHIFSFINVTDEDDEDYNGHGTYIAGIIAGTGKASSGNFEGLVPSAKLFSLKVFDKEGVCYLSDILMALDTLLSQSSLSLDILVFGGTALIRDYYDESLLYQMLEKVKEKHHKKGFPLILSPAGNLGPDCPYLPTPSNFPNVISIGSLDKEGKIAFFSSRGESLSRELPVSQSSLSKPEFFLPGVDVVSTYVSPSRIGSPLEVSPSYMELSGTSVSVALAAGLFAVLIEAFPDAPLDSILMLVKNKDKGLFSIPVILKEKKKVFPPPLSYRQILRSGLIYIGEIMLILFLFFYFLKGYFVG